MSILFRFNIKKFLSGALGAVFFIANCALAHATESNFWASRRSASQRMRAGDNGLSAEGSPNGQILFAQMPQAGPLELGGGQGHSAHSPKSSDSVNVPFSVGPKTGDWLGKLVMPYGSVNDVYLSPKKDAPFIVHIQDAHGIEEAQRNISSMIGLLGQEPGINLVGVEGAWGSFSLEPYRDFPDPAMTKDVAEFLLKKGLIAGPEYAGLTMSKSPAFFGVENSDLYHANVKALKSAFKDKEAAVAWVDALQSHTEKLKVSDYSETLKTFDRHFSGYQSEKVKLADYVRYLTTTLTQIKPRPATPQLQLLMEALIQEGDLDFKRVEAERKQMVEKLVDKLSKAQIQDLVNKSVDYRAGRVGYAEYHAHLKQTCQDHGISMKAYPQMGRYIAYVLTADKIDRRALLNELDTVERTLPESLAKTPKEKELVALTYDLSLLNKLVRHEMSPADWTHYLARRESIHTVPERVASLGGEPSPAFALTAFEDFCRFAAERNTALTGNLTQQMVNTKINSSILIAGGFHTEGLSALLRQRQISYVVVTPKITTIPKDNNYLDVLARDPVPLEQLLAGDRIYLAKPLAMADAHSSAALLISAIENLLRNNKSIVPIDDKSSLTTDPDLNGTLLFTVQGRPIYFISSHPATHPFLAWLSSLASIVSQALPENKKGKLEKEVKEIVGPKDSREIAAALSVESIWGNEAKLEKLEGILRDWEISQEPGETPAPIHPNGISSDEHASTTFILTLKGPQSQKFRAIFKADGGQAEPEVAAYAVAKVLGKPMVPPAVKRVIPSLGGPGSIHAFAVNDGEGDPSFYDSVGARDFGYFDFLIGMKDRSGSRNILKPARNNNQHIAIDHGFSLLSGFNMPVLIRNLPLDRQELLRFKNPNELNRFREALRQTYPDKGANLHPKVQSALDRLEVLFKLDNLLVSPAVLGEGLEALTPDGAYSALRTLPLNTELIGQYELKNFFDYDPTLPFADATGQQGLIEITGHLNELLHRREIVLPAATMEWMVPYLNRWIGVLSKSSWFNRLFPETTSWKNRPNQERLDFIIHKAAPFAETSLVLPLTLLAQGTFLMFGVDPFIALSASHGLINLLFGLAHDKVYYRGKTGEWMLKDASLPTRLSLAVRAMAVHLPFALFLPMGDSFLTMWAGPSMFEGVLSTYTAWGDGLPGWANALLAVISIPSAIALHILHNKVLPRWGLVALTGGATPVDEEEDKFYSAVREKLNKSDSPLKIMFVDLTDVSLEDPVAIANKFAQGYFPRHVTVTKDGEPTITIKTEGNLKLDLGKSDSSVSVRTGVSFYKAAANNNGRGWPGINSALTDVNPDFVVVLGGNSRLVSAVVKSKLGDGVLVLNHPTSHYEEFISQRFIPNTLETIRTKVVPGSADRDFASMSIRVNGLGHPEDLPIGTRIQLTNGEIYEKQFARNSWTEIVWVKSNKENAPVVNISSPDFTITTRIQLPGGVKSIEWNLIENILVHDESEKILEEILDFPFASKFSAFCLYLKHYLDLPLLARQSLEGKKIVENELIRSLVADFGGESGKTVHLIELLSSDYPDRNRIAEILPSLLHTDKTTFEAGGPIELTKKYFLDLEKEETPPLKLVIPWYNQLLVATLSWMEGKTWSEAWAEGGEKVRGKKFSIFGAPLTELPFLPGAAVWGGVSSVGGLFGISAIFSLLHNLSPPENATQQFKEARGGAGKFFVALKIVAETMGRTLGQFVKGRAWRVFDRTEEGERRLSVGVGWQFIIRTSVALAINVLALQWGGDSTLLTFVTAGVLHSVYNLAATRIGLPALVANGFFERDTRLNNRVGEIVGLFLDVKNNMKTIPNKPSEDHVISNYVKAVLLMKELNGQLANPRYGYLPHEIQFVTTTLRREVYEKRILPSLLELMDHIHDIAAMEMAGAPGVAHDLIDQLGKLSYMFSVDEQKNFLEDAHSQLRHDTLENLKKNESKHQSPLSASAILEISDDLRLSNRQKIFLEIYSAIERNNLTPSFLLMSIIGDQEPGYYSKLWIDELESILGSHWRPQMVEDDSLPKQIIELESAFQFYLEEGPKTEAEFKTQFPNVERFSSEIAALAIVPLPLAKIWLGMDANKYDKFIRGLFPISEPGIPMVIDGWKILAHKKAFNGKEYRGGIVRSLLTKFAMSDKKKAQYSGDLTKDRIVRDNLGQAYWAFVHKDDNKKIVYLLWFGTAQKAHATVSTDANEGVRQEAAKRLNSKDFTPIITNKVIKDPKNGTNEHIDAGGSANNIFYFILRLVLGDGAAKTWAMRLLPLEISGLGVAGWFAAGWAQTVLSGVVAFDPTLMGALLMAGGILAFRGLHLGLDRLWYAKNPGQGPPSKDFWSNTARMMPYAVLPLLVASPLCFGIAFSILAIDHFTFDVRRLARGAPSTEMNPKAYPNELLAERAALKSLMDEMPAGSVLTGITSRPMGTGHLWSSADFSGVEPKEISQAIDLLRKPESKVRVVRHFGEEIAAPTANTRITVGMVGYGTEAMSQEDQETALGIIQGLLKANQQILLLSDNPSILDELELTDGEKLLVQVISAHRGISMNEILNRYGRNAIPLSPIVLASEGAVDMSGKENQYQLRTFQSIAVSVGKAIAQWIAVLQSA